MTDDSTHTSGRVVAVIDAIATGRTEAVAEMLSDGCEMRGPGGPYAGRDATAAALVNNLYGATFDRSSLALTADEAFAPFDLKHLPDDGFQPVRGVLRLHAGANGLIDRVDLYQVPEADAVARTLEALPSHALPGPDDTPIGLELVAFRDAKRVTKNWGREHWMFRVGETPFGFKLIRFRAGHRTSLQFHEDKDEAYFVVAGDAVLHTAESPQAPVKQIPFPSGALAFVKPGTIHRVEAKTDVLLIEASTPDDGSDNVRLSDDYGRGHGRIEEEHSEDQRNGKDFGTSSAHR